MIAQGGHAGDPPAGAPGTCDHPGPVPDPVTAPRPARPPRWPGAVLVVAATAAALAAGAALPLLPASTAAVVLGAVLGSTGLHRPAFRAATAFASRRLLRTAVVLLGLQVPLAQVLGLGAAGAVLVLGTVTTTFAGTLLLGRLLRVRRERTLLVATGFAVCGASAIAAVRPATDADEEDTTTAIALVTLCGTLAIGVLPLLRGPLGLDVQEFGAWAGASVHDVGQAVAVGDLVAGALATVVAVKLARVLLLAPLVLLVGLSRRRRARTSGRAHRPPLLPLFVLGFVAAVALRATGALPAELLSGAARVQDVLLVAALFGLGTGIDVPRLVRTDRRSLALGLAAWGLVAGVALAGVRLLGL